MLLVARSVRHRGGMYSQGRARTFTCADHVGPGVAAGEVAIGEAQAPNRAAEALWIGLVDIEARLHRKSAHRGADRLALSPHRSGRQHHIADRSAAAELDRARDRAVAIDATGAMRAFKAVESEQLADHELPRRLHIELFGGGRSRRHKSRHHHCDTQHDELPPTPTKRLNHRVTIRINPSWTPFVATFCTPLPNLDHDSTPD